MGIAYNPSVVTNGIVLYVDAANPKSLSESAGAISVGSTWTDLSGTGNHGTIRGANTVFSTSNAGYINFDESPGNNTASSHVDFDNTPSLNMTDALSIESWVNFDDNSSDFIFEKGSVNTQYSQFSHGSDIVFRTFHSGDASFHTQQITKTTAGIVNGQWHQIVGSWDGSYKRLYVDGILKSTISKTNSLVTTTNGARIGSFGQGSFGYPLGGKIAKVAVYNIGLTEAQVVQNFNATRGRYGI